MSIFFFFCWLFIFCFVFGFVVLKIFPMWLKDGGFQKLQGKKPYITITPVDTIMKPSRNLMLWRVFPWRYDEWIKPEKIAGWGTRQTRNRTGNVGKVQDSKVTPKPMTRPTAKPAGRRSSKAAAVAPAPVKEVNTKQSPASNITKNSSKRPCSPSTRSGSLSPSLGKSSKTSSGRGTGRTRSERNSVTETSNGLDEGMERNNYDSPTKKCFLYYVCG